MEDSRPRLRHWAELIASFLLTATPSHALLDENGNGISDLVESVWHGGTLPATPFDPAADPDGDGWDNATEATAGTHPFSGSLSDYGILSPAVEIVPATYADEDNDGIPELVTPETLLLTWPSVPGKAYQVWFSSTLAPDSWLPVSDPVVAIGTELGKAVTLTQPDGTTPEKLFVRLAVSDTDSDGDDLTDHEECLAGTDPLKPDTDGDGVRDHAELSETHTNPLLALDSDDDTIPDDLEKHLARQFLAVWPEQEHWGAAVHTALLAGNLDPEHSYTGDGEPVATLVPGLRGIAKGHPDAPVIVDNLWRHNDLHAVRRNAGTQNEEVAGTYSWSTYMDNGVEDVESPECLNPAYLATRIQAIPFGEPQDDRIAFLDSVTQLISEAEFQITQDGGDIWHDGGMTQIRFRLRLPRADHDGFLGHYLKVTTRQPIGAAQGETMLVSAEPFTLSVPRGGLTSDWVDIRAEIENGMLTVVKPVRVEAAVDKNRDGIISLDSPADATSFGSPFVFWANSDCDDGHTVDGTDWEEDDLEFLAEGMPGPDQRDQRDCWTPRISCRRDLEDFSRMRLFLGDIGTVLNLWDTDLKLVCHFTPSGGDSPYLNFFQAVEPDGGTRYLTDNDTGFNQVQGDYGLWLNTADETGLAGRAWRQTGSDRLCHLLFECGEFAGPLAVTFRLEKDGATLIEFPPVHLEVKRARDMYETWSVGDVTEPGTDYDIWPANAATQSSGQNLPAPQTDEDKDYIMFVHGWNLPPWEKTAFAEAMFKRLWHEGYRGRFGAFRWPTFWFNTEFPALDNFTGSENRAWNSAAQLKVLVEDRAAFFKTDSGASRVRLYAHSMGNIVAAECLRHCGPSGSPVHTYVSAQAALSARAWDAQAPSMGNEPVMPDIYGHFWAPGSSHYLATSWGANPSYLADLRMPANTRFVNHFNKDDYALRHWRTNTRLKPAAGYSFISQNGRFYQIDSPVSGHDMSFPDERYEAFSFAAQSYSFATGAEGDTGGVFDGTLDLQNPNLQFPLDHTHKTHSGQFRSSIQKRWKYWKSSLEQMDTQTP